MLRTIIWFIYFWIRLVTLVPAMFKLKSFETLENRREFADEKARKWAHELLKLAGVKTEVIGAENIPTDGPVVYVANHQSNFDVPLAITQLPKTKGFIAKAETEKIPFVRTWMRAMQCVFIDRENMRQQVKAISSGVKLLKSGQSMVIFPEGTRSPNGQMGEFKAGSLKLATKSGVPIVPVSICHSLDIMPKGTFLIKPGQVKIVIHPAIEITSEMNRETHQLASEIKSIIGSVDLI